MAPNPDQSPNNTAPDSLTVSNDLSPGWQKHSVLNGGVIEYTFSPETAVDFSLLLIEHKNDIEKILREESKDSRIKFCMIAKVLLSKQVLGEPGIKTTEPFLRTPTSNLLLSQSIAEVIGLAIMTLSEQLSSFHEDGSNWSFDKTIFLKVQIIKVKDSVIGGHIPLPKPLQSKKACINFVNQDAFCLKYCLIAAKRQGEGHALPSKLHRNFKYLLQFENEVSFHGIEFPVALSALKQVEIQNKWLALTVFGYEHCKDPETNFPLCIYPVYTSMQLSAPIKVDLVYVQNATKNIAHFAWITNLSRFFGHLTKYKHKKKLVCRRCMTFFLSEEKLLSHEILCSENRPQRVVMPSTDILTFKKMSASLKAPAVCLYDIESLLVREVRPIGASSSSFVQHRHIPIMVGCIILNEFNECLLPLTVFRGFDCMEMFLKKLRDFYFTDFQKATRMGLTKLSPEEQTAFDSATSCFFCKTDFNSVQRVKHHSYTSGRIEPQATCSSCNHKLQLKRTIICYAHCATQYDHQALVLSLKKVAHPSEKIKVIAKSMEKFSAIFWGKICRFQDSYRLLPGSLERLSAQTPHTAFSHFENEFPEQSKRQLLMGKLPFCYTFYSSINSFNQTFLPHKMYFDNDLKDTKCLDKDYNRACDVWKQFNIKNCGDFMEIYLKSDVLSLTGIFLHARKKFYDVFKLDVCHFVSLSSYMWTCLLKNLKMPLPLLKNFDHYMFFRKAQYGGLCQATERHDKADEASGTIIQYFDAVSLYLSSMCLEKFPSGNFRWMKNEELQKVDILHYDRASPKSCYLSVDIEYPDAVHDRLISLPPAPEKRKVQIEELSPYTKKLLLELGIPYQSSCKRLVLDLNPKHNYVAHIATLQRVVKLGGKITKIHQGISFDQASMLTEFLEFIAGLRASAIDDLESELWKLSGNSIFGFSLLNVFQFQDFFLVFDENELKKLTSSPRFKRLDVFGENSVCVQLTPRCVTLSHPAYLGVTILALSKCRVFDFLDILSDFHGPNLSIPYIDTDGVLVKYRNCPPAKYAKHLENILPHLDTSNFGVESRYFSIENKRKVGFWKDEAGSKTIHSFYCIRPKLYLIVFTDGSTSQRAKGVPRSAQSGISERDYDNCYRFGKMLYTTTKSIRSFKHELFTIEQTKLSLAPADFKRFWVSANLSYPFGHWRTKLLVMN